MRIPCEPLNMKISVMNKNTAVRKSFSATSGSKVIISIRTPGDEKAEFNDENKSIKEGAEEWIKKAAKSVQWKAAGMWAAGVGIAVGLAAYLGAKFTAPKVDPEAEEQANLQAHQA